MISLKLTVVAGSIRDITNGSSLDDVSDHKLLDGLILWDAAGAVGATHGLDVAAVVLAASSITPLLSLKVYRNNSKLDLFEPLVELFQPCSTFIYNRNAMFKHMYSANSGDGLFFTR